MSDSLLALKRLLLQRLANIKGRRLSESDFAPYVRDAKLLNVSETQLHATRAALVQDGLVILEPKLRGGPVYKLAPSGDEFLRLPPPEPAGFDANLAPYQAAYLLLLLHRFEDRRASLTLLCRRISQDAKRRLGFLIPAVDGRQALNRALVVWTLDTLANKGALSRAESSGHPSYRLTPSGEEELGARDQYPNVKITLTGKELSELLAAARLGRESLIASPQAVGPMLDVPPPPRASTTAEQVLAEFERLKHERYSQHGMVPIHVLREAIRERWGAAAATHEQLDAVLNDLRRRRLVRLVALGSGGDLTEQQLADSIRGENEIYFAIESAQEHAHVG